MEKKEKKESEIKSKEIIFDDWQKDILNSDGNILLCTGRQVGKTLIFAIKAAERMVKKPGTRIVAVSLTEDQAFLMRAMVEDYLKEHYPTWLKVKKKDKPTKNKITLTNGSNYIVRPVGNTGDSIRGFTAEVLIVDEAAYMPELVWIAAKPTLLTTGGDLWLCSTPHGKEGYFYECFQNKSQRWKVFHISSEEVIYNRPISESWPESKRAERIAFLEGEKADMSAIRYAQEYLGTFEDDLRRWFTEEWIEQVCSLNEMPPVLNGKDYFLGVDIARMGEDETTFEIIDRIKKDYMEHVYNEVRKKWLTTATEDRIIDLDKIYNFKKIYIDAGAGSLGVGIFDNLLRSEQTKRKVVALNNRKIVLDREGKVKQKILKEDLYDNLRALGERGEIKLLNSDDVKLSLRSVQYEYVKSPAQKSQLRIFGNYTHIVEGLIRAAWASKEKILNIGIYSF